ncbi:MAG: hypothetical protein GWO10_02020 [candidate division Zixibacteria bacterium]|nr:hypothetical protein [candidate division Zixibacteria bacterium]NIR62583.1 hypothetical protein [candidate division Zixibacteria bacterium]NIW98480.1 hypothetical protein [Phycisphaerae bacterium]
MPWNGSTWVEFDTMNGSAGNMIEMFQYGNDVTSGAFGFLILVAVFVIIFVGSSRTAGGSSLSLSLFITAILSFLMAAMDIVIDEVAYAMLFVLMVAVALMFKGGGRDV